ncbi:phage recombination protein Bet [Methylicorpusculum oleiharenae]|uniref:phage recombination protein Bet n=1 Tax=Methylicorpusculum oleiharenae TaxID=1338687 RepID=UPI00135AB1C8|nr:phage recombination protein Bet [Methylicorpusculum oleiharenae]MCD2450539.1 phage recombination protein Bet [Methylicorpusculum oleiharenae]
MSNQNRNYPPKSRDLPMPMAAQQGYGISEQSWKVLTEVTFPTAKTPEAILMALDYCKARKLDIFKKPVHIVPMWSAALGRNVETVWPSIMEIQTTASRTGVWAGMDRPVWGPDITKTFTGRYKDDNEQWQESSVTVTFPEWVAVTVYRIVGGKRCAFTEEVYWLEAYSTAGGKHSHVPTAMWIKRPKGQLSKCGKAASLRAAFPEECGYAAEEMAGKTLDDIADGSVIDGSATLVNAAEVGSDDYVLGGDAGVDANRVIDLSQIHPKVQKAVAELVRRTRAAGAWKAAYDYAHQKFSGIDLTFALAELDKVSEVEPRTTPALGQTEATAMPPLTPKDMAMTQARQALGANR